MSKTAAAPAPSTTALTNEIRLAISARYSLRSHIFRLNVFVARTQTRTVRSAPNGTADLIGCIEGIPVAIEIKRGGDYVKKKQEEFRDQWRRAGGVYVVARNVEQCMNDISDGIENALAKIYEEY